MLRVTGYKRLLAALIVISMALCICWIMLPEKGRLVHTEQADGLTLTYVSGMDNVSVVNNRVKRILYWGYYFNRKWKYSVFLSSSKISCSGGLACFVTDDEHDYVSSDAVVFHSGRGLKMKKLPPARFRPSNQVWVFYTGEPPPKAGNFYAEENIINWTLTFLRKSDVLQNYGQVLPGRFNGGFDSSRNYLQDKTRSAVAVISNCKVADRLRIVKELSKFIDVDLFGDCGKQRLCRDCWGQLKHYKFYLAFENNLCVDYVTEKFYRNGLKFGMVPVVLGGGNYSDPYVAPPGSYINVRDFESVQELAEFLKKVGSDPQLYNPYFQWYSNYTITRGIDSMCELCAHLYQNRTTKVYEDVVQWYRTEGHCEEYSDVLRT